MARILAKLGLATTQDQGSGVYKRSVTEIDIQIETMSERVSHVNANQLIDNVRSSHRASFIFDKALGYRLDEILYLAWDDIKWKVESIEQRPPRVVVQLGEVWHG